VGKFLQLLGLQEAATATEVSILHHQVEGLQYRLQESFAQLELSRDNAGYLAIGQQYANEFTREGLVKAAEMGRIFGVANPLIKRGREMRHAYVHGQGVTVDAKDPKVNEVIQAFRDDEGNRESLFGAQAKQQYEGTLFDEGNYFIVAFTNPLDGRVQLRTIPFEEIGDVITAPGDKATPWYYVRTWIEIENGKPVTKKALHPALKYQPATRARRTEDGTPILWDAPIRHVKVNAGRGWKYGIGDSYAAIPWALSHKGFLEDWSLLMKALAKIAYVTSSKNAGQAQAKRTALKGLSEIPAGSSVTMTDDQKLEPLSKSGATLDSESSRPLATMAASALGLPVTILLADPGQTGARAVAETLDLPTRLVMQARQELHSEVERDLNGYAIEQAVLAPRGALRGLGKPLRDGDRLTVQWNDPDTASINVAWPSLDEVDVKIMLDAIAVADGMVDVPKLPLIRLALQVLKIENIDELIDEITDDSGKLIPTEVSAGDVAAKAFRDGKNPAVALK
jgi:hypothetical protein